MEQLAEQPKQVYRFVDDIPAVAVARVAERHAAQDLLNERRQQVQLGQEANVPLPVDALSTADYVLGAATDWGQDSLEYSERLRGLELDCKRLVAEWYRKKKPEYFPPIRHTFDQESEEFYSHGLSIRQMTENALTPMAHDAEEEARRINERVEDATPQLVRKLGGLALSGQFERIRTVSQCTDGAIKNYAADMAHQRMHQGYGGYVPEIEKVMIRDIWLDSKTEDRFQEQIGLPGTYITHEVFQEALRRRGVAAADDMDKTALHGAQLLVRDDLLDFAQVLDEVASEFWCEDIFMGEAVPTGHNKNYVDFRGQALRRQADLDGLAQQVTGFVLELARAGTDRRVAPGLVEAYVKRQLLLLAAQDTSLTEQMFDTKTSVVLQQAAYQAAQGRHDLAEQLLQEAERIAPGGGFCGAGSCGLESVNLAAPGGKELASKLKAEAGDKIVADKERACKCGQKKIVYAFTAKKVNKYCQGCGSFESRKGMVSQAAA